MVVVAVGWRLAAAARDVPRAERVGLLMAAVHRPMSAMHHRAETQHRQRRHDGRTTRPMTAATQGLPAEDTATSLPRLLPPRRPAAGATGTRTPRGTAGCPTATAAAT